MRSGDRFRRQRFLVGAMILAAVVLGALAGGYGIARGEQRRALRFAIDRRILVLDDDSRRAPPGGVMLIGDSIAERSGIIRLCGAPAFNAGVASITAEDLAAPARRWIAAFRPRAIVIAIGMNDANRHFRTREQGFEDAVRDIAGRGIPVGFVAIDRLEPKPGARDFSAERIDRLNDRLSAVARSLHAPFAGPIMVSTTDGVHPDDAGNRRWIDHLAGACPAEVGPHGPDAAEQGR